MTGIRRYEPLRSRHGFRHRAAQVRVADVRIVASTSTPLAASISASHPPRRLGESPSETLRRRRRDS
jgi:hypothetical protein